MKAFITGYPGTGKSSVARELKQRGYQAYDTEAMRNYMHPEDIISGRRVQIPTPVPRGWFDTTGSYNWDIPRVIVLLNSHEDVFICALADNQNSLFEYFDKIFVLVLDEVELENRLQQRTTTTYGKDHDELADILVLHKHFEQSLIENGAIAINTHDSVQFVVDELLKLTYDNT